MLQGIIIKKVLDLVMKQILKKFNLDKMQKYVEQPNELDKKVKKLEENSHPSQEYVCCKKCGCEIAKTKN